MKHQFGWIVEAGFVMKGYGPVDESGWKYDSFLMPSSWAADLDAHGCKYEVLPATDRKPERLKVEAMPNGYKSGLSVLSKAHKADVSHALVRDLSKGALAKAGRGSVDRPQKNMLILAREMRGRYTTDPSECTAEVREILTEILGGI
jgi:hypothetical protein